MQVKDVRISPGLNQAIWSRGVRSPPRRIRVRLERKRNDDEGAKEKLYVVASVVEGITSFKVSVRVGYQYRSVGTERRGHWLLRPCLVVVEAHRVKALGERGSLVDDLGRTALTCRVSRPLSLRAMTSKGWTFVYSKASVGARLGTREALSGGRYCRLLEMP
jgi:large subunit ribosomal protein L31e